MGTGALAEHSEQLLLQMAVPWPFVWCLSAQRGASAVSRACFCAVSSCLEQLRSSLCSPHVGCRNSGFLGSDAGGDAHVWKCMGAAGAPFLFPAVLWCLWVFLCLQYNLLFDLLQDLPSFTQNVHRLVNDLRYYRLCNDSLPPGTVKL